jgi:predicted PolB exonuclease-like 3'-5' exonuclease
MVLIMETACELVIANTFTAFTTVTKDINGTVMTHNFGKIIENTVPGKVTVSCMTLGNNCLDYIRIQAGIPC